MIPIPAVASFVASNWRLVVLGLLLAALGIQTWRLDRCQSQFEEFRISTEAIARAQAAKNAAIIESNEQIAREVVKGKDDAILSIEKSYQRARRELAAARRLRDNPGGGGVPAQPEAAPESPALESACRPTDGVAGDQTEVSARLSEVEAALLDLMERADAEMTRYRALWVWANRVR